MTSARRTYWHLERHGRVPNDYDIASGHLLYYLPRGGFEVATRAGAWHLDVQQGSALRARDWELFRDPRELTYARYCEDQKRKEAFVDGLLSSMSESDYDRALSPRWLEMLERLLPVARFPCHGLQMVAAFLGQTAPASRLVIGCLFQVGDEIRRIQRLAMRMRELERVHARFGNRSREAWQSDAEWQPLRRLVETLLVTYDFGEAYVALNLALKPAFDRFFSHGLGRLAEQNGDPLLGKLLFSLAEDSARQREFSLSVMHFALGDTEENRSAIEAWSQRWRPRVLEAIGSLAPLFGSEGNVALDDATSEMHRTFATLGLAGGRP